MGSPSEGPGLPFTVGSKQLLMNVVTLLYHLPLWVVIGPFFLLYALASDVTYVVKAMRATNV